MKYISTRGNAEKLGFKEVALSALAPDGGLYVPENIPKFTLEEIKSWKNLSYQELVKKVIAPFISDEIPESDLTNIIEKSYSTFRHDDIAPLHHLRSKCHSEPSGKESPDILHFVQDDTSSQGGSGKFVLELFHGPTLAFKDFALQFLGNLLEYLLEEQGEEIIIIGATSGDTGSAAIEGCRNSPRIKLFMLHPYGRVSDIQRRQMTTVISDNIHNIAVKTDFDGCQAMVKEMFANPDFAGGRKLVAVNSINWVRIMAQTVYYFSTALKLDLPNNLSFSVPTGNFGDIYAGYIAKRMGLPINKLIVATNSNDILHRFFSNNDYSQGQVTPTLSPSMDIQVSSNFERLLFELHNRDGAKVAELMNNSTQNKKLSVSDDILAKAREVFDSKSADDNAIQQTIKETYEKYNYVADPHTAAGIYASHIANTPVVTLSTAHPAKFPDAVKGAIGITPEVPDFLKDKLNGEEKYDVVEDDLDAVRKHIASLL